MTRQPVPVVEATEPPSQVEQSGPSGRDASSTGRPQAWTVYVAIPVGLALALMTIYLLQKWLGHPVGVFVATAAVALAVFGVVWKRPATFVRLGWDGVGVLGVGSVSLLAALVLAATVDTPRPGFGELALSVLMVGAFGIALCGIAAVVLQRRDRLPIREIPQRLLMPWTAPIRDWGMFALGTLVAVPLFATHIDVSPNIDAARLIASVLHVWREGPAYLPQTQDVALPYLFFGPLLLWTGIPGATAFALTTFAGLTGSISYVAWRLTRSGLGALVAVLAAFSATPFVVRAQLLPMYPAMLMLGYLGAWFGYRAMTHEDGRRRLWLAAVSALLLVLCTEAHAVGRIFLVVPAVLFLSAPSMARFWGTVRIGLFALVFSIPRIAINLMDGGFDYFLSQRTEWMVTRGYLRLVNANFFEHPVNRGPAVYLEQLGRAFVEESRWPALVFLAVVAVAVAFLPRRALWVGILATGAMVAGMLVKTPPPLPRYLTPIIPVAALGVATAVGRLFARGSWRRVVALAMAGAVGVGATGAVFRAVLTARQSAGTNIRFVASRINDDRAVIGVRAPLLMSSRTDLSVYYPPFLTEREFLTYLTWPSDRKVIRLLRSKGIGWVFVTIKKRDVLYHQTWVGPTYGLKVRHATEVEKSPNFCEIATVGQEHLYRLGSCPPGYRGPATP